eukprot:TRINITY_DN18129_c0_g1_i1.p1 TRINITY_DN18129_c0_g1~~TRINITY_DN18129_c0_g1_i1.p1  ORF type:complete len:121 (+),score=13.21 TRINITY_DN18129_c0_g1_i1:152-514(+)
MSKGVQVLIYSHLSPPSFTSYLSPQEHSEEEIGTLRINCASINAGLTSQQCTSMVPDLAKLCLTFSAGCEVRKICAQKDASTDLRDRMSKESVVRKFSFARFLLFQLLLQIHEFCTFICK